MNSKTLAKVWSKCYNVRLVMARALVQNGFPRQFVFWEPHRITRLFWVDRCHYFGLLQSVVRAVKRMYPETRLYDSVL